MKQLRSAMKLVEIIIWSYLIGNTVSGLPVTSKPLENNVDHLISEAEWFSHGAAGRHDMNRNGGFLSAAKKITPKSIFITPNFNNLTAQLCPPGFKIDERGQCIQVISINQEDLLVTRLQSILSQTTDNAGNVIKVDYYDYDEESNESNEFPYQVNLPLSISIDNDNNEDSDDDEKILESFLDKPSTSQYKQQPISFIPFDSELIEKLQNSEQIQDSSSSSATESTVKIDTTLSVLNNTEIDNLYNSTSSKTSITDGDENNASTLIEATTENTKEINSESESDVETETESENELAASSNVVATTDLEVDGTTTTIPDTDETTVKGIFEEVSESDELKNSTVDSEFLSSSDDIEIVTDDMSGDGSGDSITFGSISVDFVSEKPNENLQMFENLRVQNETAENVKNRDSIIKQEEKYQELESIDSFNRFVYHHLPSVDPPTTTTIAPEISPPFNNQLQNNQVEMVHRIVEETKKQQENRDTKIRFPSPTEENQAHPHYPTQSASVAAVRFPGEVTNRLPTFKSVQNLPASSTPSLWFLPNGFDVDKTGQKPNLLKFWSRMPLIQDPLFSRQSTSRQRTSSSPIYLHSQQPFSNPPNPNIRHRFNSNNNHRENSKSPSENFYKQVSAQMIKSPLYGA